MSTTTPFTICTNRIRRVTSSFKKKKKSNIALAIVTQLAGRRPVH